MKYIFTSAFFICALTLSTFAQTTSISGLKIEMTPTYKLLIDKKTTANAELQQLLRQFTNGFPDVQDKRTEISGLEVEIAKLYAFEPSKYNLLSKGYGELILSKIEAEKDLKRALGSYTFKHPALQQKAQTLKKLENEIANYFN